MEDWGTYVPKEMIADGVGPSSSNEAAASDGLLVERNGAGYKKGTRVNAGPER